MWLEAHPARSHPPVTRRQVGENVALSHKFHANMNAVLSMVASLKVQVPPLPASPSKAFISPGAIPEPAHGLYPSTGLSIDPSNVGAGGGGGSLASTPMNVISALPPG